MLESLKQFITDEAGVKALEELQTKATALVNANGEATERITNLESSVNHYKGEVKVLASEKGQWKEDRASLELKLSNADNTDTQAMVDKLNAEHQKTIDGLTGERDGFRSKLIDSQTEADFGNLNIPFATGLTDADRNDAKDLIKMRVMQGYSYDEGIGKNVYKDGDIIRKNGENPYTMQEVFDNLVTGGSFGKYLNTTPNPSGAGKGNTDSGGPSNNTIEVKKGNANALMDAAFENK